MKGLNAIYILFLITPLFFSGCNEPEQNSQKPNIILIYLDDLGYGDPGCYNPESKIPTPNIDKLAEEGMRFTNAHTAAAICGPSRYGILTGRYPWRKAGGTNNGHAYDPVRIEQGRLTIANLLKEKGYNTAIFGKWGLRYDYKSALKEGVPYDVKQLSSKSFDYTKPIHGANIRGFDYSFCNVYFGNKEKAHPSALNNNHWMFENGMILDAAQPNFAAYDHHGQQPRITQKTNDYLDVFVGKKENKTFKIDPEKPFFIYYSSSAPHDPIVPNKEFIGRSKAGKYGDFVCELDYHIGQIMEQLEALNLAENTMIILSSDNGPETHAYKRIQEFNHYSMGQWRGLKRDNYEGGNRVPLIIKWPGKLNPKSVNDSQICLTDILATFGDMLGVQLEAGQGEDSYSFLSQLSQSPSDTFNREPIIYHTHTGKMGIRDGDWVYIDAPTGMQSREPEWFRKERGVKEHKQQFELYNLQNDPQQITNLSAEYRTKVEELKSRLSDIIKDEGKQK